MQPRSIKRTETVLLMLMAVLIAAMATTARAWQNTSGEKAADAEAPASSPSEGSQPPKDFSPPRAEPSTTAPRRPVVTAAPEVPDDPAPSTSSTETKNDKPAGDTDEEKPAAKPSPIPSAPVSPAETKKTLPPDASVAPATEPANPVDSAVPSAEKTLLSQKVFATNFDDPPPYPAATVEVGGFKGVQPGVTSMETIAKQWGEGTELEGEDDEVVRSYKLENFPRIDVAYSNNIAKSIVVYLGQPAPPDALAQQLNLGDVRPVPVPDEMGELLGQAYPERGVVFGFAPKGRRVAHVMLEEIDIESFVLRAETYLATDCRHSMADLNYVLSKDPNHARALWLKAKLLLGAARYKEAKEAIKAALKSEPDSAEFRLTQAKILGLLGEQEDAISQTREISQDTKLSDGLRARALCQLGDLLAAHPNQDYKEAMENHLAAIELADPLSIDKNATIRREAKELLVDAHLAAANNVALGAWQQKERVAPKWLDRAKAYAEDLISKENGDAELMLRVAAGALRVSANVQGKIDPVPWTRLALAQGKHLIAAADDPWRKTRLEWELGCALFDSLTADDLRRDSRHSLTNSTLTITYLEQGAKTRAETPEDVFLLGRIYYRVGSLHAVQRGDHATAVTWYEKAVPMLNRPLPPSQASLQGRYGEWLVSMGISFWEVGRRDDALKLTEEGTRHVEEAVGKNLLDRQALAVPYGNLSAMHGQLGNSTEAEQFAELAAKLDGTSRK